MRERWSCYYLRQKRDEREKELILVETERLNRNRSEMELILFETEEGLILSEKDER
jgi:hypothetical protein